MRKHIEDCLDANDDTSGLKGKCICKPAHTPTPWRIRKGSWECESGYQIASKADEDGFGNVIGYSRMETNAAFIVRAVNSHEELIEAAQNALNVLAGLAVGHLNSIKPDSRAILMLREVLAKTEGK